MKSLGNVLFETLKELEILEPETLLIAEESKKIPNADLLKIDSILKLNKYKKDDREIS